MKISELIAELQKNMAEHGDIEIRYMQMPINMVFKGMYDGNWIRMQ